MFLMALPLPWNIIQGSIAKPWPAILGSLINLFLVPIVACIFAIVLPTHLGQGLLVTSLYPAPLLQPQSGRVALERDETYAVLITLITTFASVVVIPIGMVWLLKTSVQIEVLPLMSNLALLIIAPILLAQMLRRSRRVGHLSQSAKPILSIACQMGILLMVLVGAVQMGLKLFDQTSQQSSFTFVGDLLLTCLAVVSVHLLVMACALYLAKATGIEPKARTAVAFAGSQKTLMIGLKLAIDAQASILPMVAYHVLQLIIDAYLAARWTTPKRLPANEETTGKHSIKSQDKNE